MSRWTHLWSHWRLRGANKLAHTIKQRTQTFVHKLYDSTTVTRWLRAHRRQHYARAMACVRAVLDTPRRRALMLSATGVYKNNGTEDQTEEQCGEVVTDQEIEDLKQEIERMRELSRATLYCPRCSLRRIIDTKHDGVKYCTCNGKSSPLESHDGWTPYMETQDVIIWRKEYVEGSGLFMYKVYGRYADVSASDFASVQTNSAYRREWDTAVASLYTVEKRQDSCVIHWEVIWPRLFANRDYVYIRRHKEFFVDKEVENHEPLMPAPTLPEPDSAADETRPSADVSRASPPSTAKRKDTPERLVVIVSKSCPHPRVPVRRNAIRVTEYWSRMVIQSLGGADNTGMEFVLTYYDQPAVGGMPGGVTAWATGRAAPEYLTRMHLAAMNYAQWLQGHATEQDECFEGVSTEEEKQNGGTVREEDMESSQRGPIIDLADGAQTPSQSSEQQSQTSPDGMEPAQVVVEKIETENADIQKCEQEKVFTKASSDGDCENEEEPDGWWRYLYPFYYFA